jgi:SAM-dependent methyltransferase
MTLERERISGREWPWLRHEHLSRYEFAAQRIPGGTVVDCASGAGFGTRVFAATSARRIVGIERDLATIRRARNVAPSAHFCCGDAHALPLASECVDVFVSLETIEHLDGDRNFLEEVARVLQPAGMFICSTPNRLVTNPGTGPRDRPWNRFHVREYSPTELLAMLSEFFADVQIFGQNPVRSSLLSAARCIAGRVSARLAVRFLQAFKLPRLVSRDSSQHRVRLVQEAVEYEYTVVECCRPRSAPAFPKIWAGETRV